MAEREASEMSTSNDSQNGMELARPIKDDPRIGRTVKLEEYPAYTFTITTVWYCLTGEQMMVIVCDQYPRIEFDVKPTAVTMVEEA